MSKELKEPTIIHVIENPNLLRPLLVESDEPLDSWFPWMVVLKLVYGIRLNDDEKNEKELIRTNAFDFDDHSGWVGTELEFAKLITGGAITDKQEHEGRGYRRVYIIVGRRGGKSKIISVINAYQASFRDYRKYITRGEKIRVVTIAPSMDQGEIILDYCSAAYELACLEGQLASRGNRADGKIAVNQKINIKANLFDVKVMLQVLAANYKNIRGRTIASAILEELAFWQQETDYKNPDYKILSALTPALASLKDMGKLFGISSAYTETGVLYDRYSKHFGVVGSKTLVVKAPTWVMNPSIDREFLEEEREEDPESFKAEYGSEFRNDIEGYQSARQVRAMTDPGVTVREYSSDFAYTAFVDPSGGSKDEMTLGISHEHNGIRIEDVNLAVSPPFSPQDDAVPLFAKTMKKYRVSSCYGDSYAGKIFKAEFKKHGIRYLPPTMTDYEKVDGKKKKVVTRFSRSDIYMEILPMLNAQQVRLLDIEKKNSQIWNLERRPVRGKDVVDHPRGKHDDRANSTLGSLLFVGKKVRRAGAGYA